jgi:hypothetical protein
MKESALYMVGHFSVSVSGRGHRAPRAAPAVITQVRVNFLAFSAEMMDVKPGSVPSGSCSESFFRGGCDG